MIGVKSDNLYNRLPVTPGVYILKDSGNRILYIGKAGNLKRRVSSYFLKPHDSRIDLMVQKIRKFSYRRTDSALEALILESKLIKKHNPPFNIREKDDTSFLFFEITNDEFPCVKLVRGRTKPAGERFGPFVSAGQAREAGKILRRIFPWNTHSAKQIGKLSQKCFDAQIGLCPGTCVGEISQKEYMKNIRNIKLFLSGRKKQVIKNLEKEMKEKSKNLHFEDAEKIKKQIFALNHIQDTAFVTERGMRGGKEAEKRVEGYDISNISGTNAVGVMVVFEDGKMKKSEYRKFTIKTVKGSDDVAMLREVLSRRFKHKEWRYPDLVLVDGGVAQVNMARKETKIPVLGIAKGPTRKKNEFVGKIPSWIKEESLIQIRDEAHRYAIAFHRKRRSDTFIQK